jgi:hypothetical protein
MLDYKTIMGDLLVFKDKSTLTISRGGLGEPWIDTIEVDGEQIDYKDYDDETKHPFTEQEIDYFINHYEYIVGSKY